MCVHVHVCGVNIHIDGILDLFADEYSASLNHGIMDRNASHCHYYGCDTPKLFSFDTNDSLVITDVTMLIQDLRVETYCLRDSAKNGSIDLHCEYATVHSLLSSRKVPQFQGDAI